MEFGYLLLHVNYGAVLLSAVMSMLIGSLWYSPFVFGKKLVELNGMTEEELEKRYPNVVMYGSSFLLSFFAALVLALFLDSFLTWANGVIDGILIALFLIGTSRASAMLLDKQPAKLYLIHVGYDVVRYAVMGAIIGGWH
ncbi:MAG: DUF1761 domain-containing protein [Bacteroidota bacterium]|nr:DUF1761 domain-containing protein [Bacteroidota bacterium]MDP4204744.1 DUF1761 domain-containing protein [Bacteroidota bacterium]